ncbi:MAG TPA: metalloregulator ArsR/SmtB family transcription factor [Nitrospiria bacterium]|nr:metalloregulator ArsR/SmtB family transcription factor [Nitrospiria bacterium]
MEIKKAVNALSALAQDTRLSIFRLLVKAGPDGLPVGRIGGELGVPGATLSFHLKELSHAGLVTVRQEGRYLYHSVDFKQMAALMTFLTEHCCDGMPQACFAVVETALSRCCPAQSTRQSVRRDHETISRAHCR